MKYEDFTKITGDILKNLSDQGAVSTNLATLNEDYKAQVAAIETANAELERLKTENKNLQQANYKLFNQLGEQLVNKDLPKTNEESSHKDEQSSKLTYEALFNEKGELI